MNDASCTCLPYSFKQEGNDKVHDGELLKRAIMCAHAAQRVSVWVTEGRKAKGAWRWERGGTGESREEY
eukprot:6191717-Pleurochrysis_carterae.AAC.8